MTTRYRQVPGRPQSMDNYGYVDYKMAVKGMEDLRTSSQRAHRYITDITYDSKGNRPKRIPHLYMPTPALEEKRCVTEYRESYKYQFDDPNEVKNPSLCRRCEFIKPLADTKMKFIKRPIKPAVSVSHEDYVCPAPLPEFPPMEDAIPAIPKPTKLDLQTVKPSVGKLLDPNATTNRLDFIRYDNKAYNAGKDVITYWNWDKHYSEPKKVFPYKDIEMCDKYPSLYCVKRRCEYINQLKAVPHSGMTTEVRDNYTPKQNLVNDFTLVIADPIVFGDIRPSAKKTEYSTIGSGERTEKYV